MTDTSAPRETRTCQKCGQEDDHPHHVQYTAFNHPVTGEAQDLSVSKHVDCCAEDGCLVCATSMQHAPDGAHGPSMQEYLTNPPDDYHKDLFEQHGIETPNYTVTFADEEASS